MGANFLFAVTIQSDENLQYKRRNSRCAAVTKKEKIHGPCDSKQ